VFGLKFTGFITWFLWRTLGPREVFGERALLDTRGLHEFERGLLGWFALALGLVLAIMTSLLWALARGLKRISGSAAGMRAFDFSSEVREKNEEPKLGGELAELTLMFTDIEGFTTLAERLGPEELSERLGSYLQTITECVQEPRGHLGQERLEHEVVLFAE